MSTAKKLVLIALMMSVAITLTLGIFSNFQIFAWNDPYTKYEEADTTQESGGGWVNPDQAQNSPAAGSVIKSIKETSRLLDTTKYLYSLFRFTQYVTFLFFFLAPVVFAYGANRLGSPQKIVSLTRNAQLIGISVFSLAFFMTTFTAIAPPNGLAAMGY